MQPKKTISSDWAPDIYINAYRFAAVAHNGQTVPGTDLPYIMHLSFVAMEVIATLGKEQGFDGNLAVQCALLHDTVEDTDTEIDDLAEKFGSNVADGVAALTKTLWHRKKLQMADSLKRIRKQPREIWVVKMADRVTNLQPPPNYWTQGKVNRYRKEAIEIYKALKGGSPYLSDRLKRKIEAYP